MPSERNSAHWQPNLEKLSEEFYSKWLNPKCVNYRKVNFNRVRQFCDHCVDILKNEMYPSLIIKSDRLLDRHKIVAVHITGFLKTPLFSSDSAVNGRDSVDMLANEYYCFLVLQAIINEWPHNKKDRLRLSIPNEYRDCLLKLFYKYRKSSLPNTSDTTFIYALASIVYFVEKSFSTTLE
ncbi:MAG: hypothetical protein LBB56_03505 [Chitinispirillales bacterium]|jgi:hypothetical protein|nr:hypothetical protein [Chitinispirillales bacterium]